jgi:hypothetical protein
MKKFLIGIGVAVVVILLIILLVFGLTKGIAESGNRFFSLVKEGRIEEAYSSTAKEFRAATSEKELRDFLAKSSLDEFESASWSSRSISGKTGKLEGSINTQGGGVVPIEIEFVKEGGSWKILALRKTSAGLVQKEEEKERAPAKKEIPSDRAIINLANDTILILARDLNKNEYSDFYASIAKLWQNQTDKDALRNVFSGFASKKIDLTIIEGETPVFSQKPYIDDKGLLRLRGYYPTKPYTVHFELKYIYEHPHWKLIEIDIKTK